MVYAPSLTVANGVPSTAVNGSVPFTANSIGFISVSNLMTDAENALAADGNTVAAGTDRTSQQLLEQALDQANNGLTVVKPFSGAGSCSVSKPY